jgi:hypothetical protein
MRGLRAFAIGLMSGTLGVAIAKIIVYLLGI